MSEKFIFSAADDLRERIISALDGAEKRTSARLLPRERLEEVIEAVASRPFGYVTGNGGSVANSYRHYAETTRLILAWYTWRKKKYIYLEAWRGCADKVRYGSPGHIHITFDRKSAYETVFPDRARKYRWARNKRRIRDHTKRLPSLPEGIEITTIYPDTGGIVAAETRRYDVVLIGTPVGWIPVPSRNWKYRHELERRSAWNILADLGFPVPRRKAARVWTDELTAYATMFVLGR